MTDKELNEVSNRIWDAFTDQMPEVFTGRDLLKIVIRFVVNTANALDTKPTTVCMMMYDTLNDERHSVKAVKSIEGVLLFAGIVVSIIGALCVIWFDYKLGTKIFDVGCICVDVGCICILACWTFKFAIKVIDRWL